MAIVRITPQAARKQKLVRHTRPRKVSGPKNSVKFRYSAMRQPDFMITTEGIVIRLCLR